MDSTIRTTGGRTTGGRTAGGRTTRGSLAVAGTLGAAGLALATVGVMYIAGMFGLSTAFATQIVNAVEVGGIALAIVMGLLSGGIAAAVISTTRWAIAQWGKAAAVA